MKPSKTNSFLKRFIFMFFICYMIQASCGCYIWRLRGNKKVVKSIVFLNFSIKSRCFSKGFLTFHSFASPLVFQLTFFFEGRPQRNANKFPRTVFVIAGLFEKCKKT